MLGAAMVTDQSRAALMKNEPGVATATFDELTAAGTHHAWCEAAAIQVQKHLAVIVQMSGDRNTQRLGQTVPTGLMTQID